MIFFIGCATQTGGKPGGAAATVAPAPSEGKSKMLTKKDYERLGIKETGGSNY